VFLFEDQKIISMNPRKSSNSSFVNVANRNTYN